MIFIYNINPVAKPRMTRKDRWAKRPAVLRYFAFKDEVRLNKIQVPESGAGIAFIIPMPKSWTKKKKRTLDGKPHQQTPDLDNLLKALLDAVYDDDSGVWHLWELSKCWGKVGQIKIDTY